MQVTHDLRTSLGQETILTIGAFDGVHRGHQALIRRVVDRARDTGRLAGLITFHPHPALFLASERAAAVQPFYLTTPGEKLVLLEGLGLDLVALLTFDQELAHTSARDFMGLAVQSMRVRELWVGPDFRLGRNQEGDVASLRVLGREMGYEVNVFEPVFDRADEPSVISSSRIRTLLREGEVERVAEMLGRYASISGEVVPGAHRGHRLGFPTANLEVRAERALPANGVYAVYAVLGKVRHQGVANVGTRPSFDDGPRTVETHVLDLDADLYGCDLVVEFVARLRDEKRFANVDDLIAQIRKDCRAARRVLQTRPPDDPGAREGSDGASESEKNVPCRTWAEEVEHTADRALRVWGQGLADLFAGAARGMVRLMADLNGLIATQWREVRLEALDRETLLVAWLNELLYLTESEDMLFLDFQVKSVTETALVAWVGATPGRATKAYLKAATFHALEVTQGPAGWSTVITFDT